MKRWFERLPERFRLEVKLIKQFYPNSKVTQNNRRIEVYLKFRWGRKLYNLLMYYPNRFPYEQPEVIILSPKLFPAPHMFRDGRLCLWGVDDVGPQTSGKVILDWACGWIRSYEEYRSTNKWPEGNKWNKDKYATNSLLNRRSRV
jgi:ubiquitin-protein ligase